VGRRASEAHQGDVYSASFAAGPHVVEALARAPERATGTYFQFPAWVEICRCRKSIAIPSDLQADYFEALTRLPDVATVAS